MKHIVTGMAAALALSVGIAPAPVALSPVIRRIAADNSRVNSMLKRSSIQTAQDQPNDRQDRVTAARVRRAIIADDTLSVYGHNVKIIVAGGRVTLEGPVHTENERQEIAFDAASVVAAASIVDRITVA